MRQLITKIISFLLAFLVLFSTFSFTVAKHYCGDLLVDVSFTGQAEGCAMNMDSVTSPKKKNCCKDEVHQIDGQDQLQFNKVDKISFSKQQFIASFLTSYTDLFLKNESENNFYNNFSPPDIRLEYHVLYQIFLI
ncbi:HYC_CC_PP family protein [Polaribacter glomeratus]|uniref:Secreted protein n=1 Tax=Polaribacter glomeratus TaxID=102 RepID=A0A2S7WZ30_9FLAO|nr:hypothetical protein [Polaribacter glomeratus]PQJ82850.1 hypothetical protein BTO16_09790 [Polaribacter glomeratus]TXD65393.1 hypothetical protein ESX12_11270 [Polaribacter glomeratus]